MKLRKLSTAPLVAFVLNMMQMLVVDTTAMPVSGRVYMGSYSGYSPAVNEAFGSKTCSIEGATVCAFNSLDGAQVCRPPLRPGSMEWEERRGGEGSF